MFRARSPLGCILFLTFGDEPCLTHAGGLCVVHCWDSMALSPRSERDECKLNNRTRGSASKERTGAVEPGAEGSQPGDSCSAWL